MLGGSYTAGDFWQLLSRRGFIREPVAARCGPGYEPVLGDPGPSRRVLQVRPAVPGGPRGPQGPAHRRVAARARPGRRAVARRPAGRLPAAAAAAQTPQGSSISPVLANLFMHYAFGTWLSRKFPLVRWERYAADAVIHCVSEYQARKVLAAVHERMAGVGLELHPGKTAIVYCKDYYGAFYPSALYPVLRRISTYLMRWLMNKLTAPGIAGRNPRETGDKCPR
ncbi:MAG TPA: reverse transcriptase domain-containing protein [Streptosporangiaceae bacterium]|nr:reverse transcriptase domain-containing protein [Streptosporangiaceae bacterium]